MLIHSDNGTKFANETFEIGCNRLAIDYVLRKTTQYNKQHGSWNGPFLVVDTASKSTLLLKNLTTGTELQAAKKDCEIYNAENPQGIKFLKTIAAGDAEIRTFNRKDSFNESSAPERVIRSNKNRNYF
ncbi:hypothetical protein P9112_010146 [Eukaryota sp. TZLM1-RC]